MTDSQKSALLDELWEEYSAEEMFEVLQLAKQAGKEAAERFHREHGYEIAHAGHFFEYFVRPHQNLIDSSEFHDQERMELIEGNSSGDNTPIEISFAAAWNERMLAIMKEEDAGHMKVRQFIEWDRREHPEYFAMRDQPLEQVLEAHRQRREAYREAYRAQNARQRT